jgi:hypothetical protein
MPFLIHTIYCNKTCGLCDVLHLLGQPTQKMSRKGIRERLARFRSRDGERLPFAAVFILSEEHASHHWPFTIEYILKMPFLA